MTPELAIAGLGILILSVIAHEVAHGYMALSLGDPTARLSGRLTLNPAKHFDPIGSFVVPLFSILFFKVPFGWAKPVPYNPYNLRNQRWGEALVAAAGPLTNLLIALIFGVITRLAAPYISEAMQSMLVAIVDINLALMVFNLVPIPPLDGFKVFTAFLSARHAKFVYFMEHQGIVILLIFVFFLSSYISPVINFLHNIILSGF